MPQELPRDQYAALVFGRTHIWKPVVQKIWVGQDFKLWWEKEQSFLWIGASTRKLSPQARTHASTHAPTVRSGRVKTVFNKEWTTSQVWSVPTTSPIARKAL